MNLFVSMQTFVAIVRSGSMNAAAQKLNVTSALVGQRIAALEDRLQTRLLNRSTRHQSLTDFGTIYFQQCLDILELVSLSEGQAEAQLAQPQGLLRVTAPMSFGSESLIPALKKFNEIAPNVEVDVILSDQNLDLIPEGVDVAFRIGQLDDSSFIMKSLAPYPMVICAAPAYIAQHGTPERPKDLANHHAVLFTRSAHRPWRLEKENKKSTWLPTSNLKVNSGHAVRVAITEGLGLAMLPELLVRKDLASGRLIQLLPDWQLPQQPMSLLFHKDRHIPLRLRRFVDFATSEFRQAL